MLRRLLRNKNGMTNLIPAVLAVVITFAVIFIGSFVNGEIDDALEDSYPAAASRNVVQNNTLNTMSNKAGNISEISGRPDGDRTISV